MELKLNRLNDAVHFEVINTKHQNIHLDGATEIGGENKGYRPMELLLAGITGCASIDIVLILQKQRQKLIDIQVIAKAKRDETVPKVFTEIDLHFAVWGNISSEKLEKAIQLSTTKYCSAILSLNPTVKIITSYHILS